MASLQVYTVPVAPGVTLECAESGLPTGEPVLLLHGNGPNWRQFEPQLAALADRWRVLAPSLRGHGASTVPAEPSPADFSLERLAADVAALLDHLGVERAHVIGNSVGGLIGCELLRTRAGRVASLVTFGTTAELTSRRGTVAALGLATRLLGAGGMARIAGRTVADRTVGRRIAELIRTADVRALRLVSRGVATYDYTLVLRASTVPWLLLRGEGDRSINQHLASTLRVAEARDDAWVEDLADAGHFANLERPEAFDAAVRRFLLAHPLEAAPGGAG